MFGLRAGDCLSEARRLMVVRRALCRRTSVAVAGRKKSSASTADYQSPLTSAYDKHCRLKIQQHVFCAFGDVGQNSEQPRRKAR